MAYILLDDPSINLTLSDPSGSAKVVDSSDSWLGGTAVEVMMRDDNPNMSVNLTFSGMPKSCHSVIYNPIPKGSEGVAAAFYGSVKGVEKTTNVAISVDGNTQVVPIAPNTDPWFSTKTLPDAQHNVAFLKSFPFSLDFIAITPGNDTSLVGKQLIVDDSHPSLAYTGWWTRNTSAQNMPFTGYNVPFGGGFQLTQDVQASATFTFVAGTSVKVYGLSFQDPPPLYPIFNLDGHSQPRLNDATKTQTNFLWFSHDDLSPGSHVLTIEFDPALSRPGGVFALDYVLYSPSFPSIASQGNYTGVTAGATTSPGQSPTGLPSSSSTNSDHDSKAVLIGAPVGAVVGTLVLACLIFVFRKKIFSRLAPPAMKRDLKRRPTPLTKGEEFPPLGPVPAAASLVNPFSEPYSPTSGGPSGGLDSIVSPGSLGITNSGSQNGSRIQLVVQGGNPDMVQVPPPEKSSWRTPGGLNHPSSATSGPSAGAGPSSGMTVDRTQRIQGLVNELQQEIVAGGIVVTPETDDVSPPPYELPNRRANP
ncbi:hypothetical protein C0995_007756 [Termitomyces sp. Mi166|nr:hypothetical protein C0995_007756 [Termitomyces sp. Mi166\